jgi:hypothetical protein
MVAERRGLVTLSCHVGDIDDRVCQALYGLDPNQGVAHDALVLKAQFKHGKLSPERVAFGTFSLDCAGSPYRHRPQVLVWSMPASCVYMHDRTC